MKKRLTKSSDNVVISGVLGGIADYLKVDPTIVRIIYVILTFSTAFAGIPMYIIMALVMPSGRKNTYQGSSKQYQGGKGQPKRKEAQKIDDDDWSDF
ncbi:PspC domain-containing protein [Vagococcus vulneris]|uniref:PspC family transcriptional regulator n=1 Tax=Vagococcus vulneris TaxID=1977869 RepID=A0A429ZXV7_9ENTE|nr:PspC domain-containing protein [Vagococcus vulneris]RST98739.1 PspC family transcriptional regulator [Vagococcus vulneris]